VGPEGSRVKKAHEVTALSRIHRGLSSTISIRRPSATATPAFRRVRSRLLPNGLRATPERAEIQGRTNEEDPDRHIEEVNRLAVVQTKALVKKLDYEGQHHDATEAFFQVVDTLDDERAWRVLR
jgi:hypothetical protein